MGPKAKAFHKLALMRASPSKAMLGPTDWALAWRSRYRSSKWFRGPWSARIISLSIWLQQTAQACP